MANSIKYIFGADATAFHAATKGMEKGTQAVQKNIVGSFQKIGGAIAAAFSLQQIASFFSSISQYTRELATMSDTAGITAERLQSLALGSETMQISQEKLADILKDVNDKFGDFLQTGAGPMKDFFEFIAPQVGLTADAFKNLTSDQILIKYVKALEDANVSQAEMTFYMEAIASDSTKLLPLIRNNAAAWEEYAEKAKGAILSDEDIASINKANEAFERLGRTLKIQTGGALADWIQAVDGGLVPTLGKIIQETSPAIKVFGILKDAVNEAKGPVREFFREAFPDSTVDLAKPIEEAEQAVKDLVVTIEQIDEGHQITNESLKEYSERLDKINDQLLDQKETVIETAEAMSNGQKIAQEAIAEYQEQVRAANQARDAAAEKARSDKESVGHLRDQAEAATVVADQAQRVNDLNIQGGGGAGLTSMSILPGGIVPGGADIDQLIGFARTLENMQATANQFKDNWRYRGGQQAVGTGQDQVQRDLRQVVNAVNDLIKLQGGRGMVTVSAGGSITDQILRGYTRATQPMQQLMTRQEQLLATIANNTKRG